MIGYRLLIFQRSVDDGDDEDDDDEDEDDEDEDDDEEGEIIPKYWCKCWSLWRVW